MVEKLKNPPLEEVVCSFVFNDSCEDLTFYGLLHEKIKKLFPQKTKTVFNDFIYEEIDSKVIPKPIEINIQQFLNNTNNTYLDVGSNQISIHQKKPYSNWNDFSPIINTAFKHYIEITELKELSRIKLEYKNHIYFEQDVLDMEDYFHFRPEFTSELGSAAGPMIAGASFPKNSDNDFLRITLFSKEPPRDKKHFISLHLEYFSVNPESISIDSTTKWLDIAHDHLNKAFGLCIAEKLLQEFN